MPTAWQRMCLRLLRSLLSQNARQREHALYELFGTIWHQGTVYPATAAAVPFLYELLAGADVPDKSSIAGLLACIADGGGYLEAHAADEYGDPIWHEILEEQGKSLEAELAREATEISLVRQAVSAGLRRLFPYLQDPDPEIRRYVAVALGSYPEHVDQSLPALQAAAAMEADSDVLEALHDSISSLTKRRSESRS